MPLPLCDLLLAGTVGREHLLRAAGMAGKALAAACPTDRNLWQRRRLSLLAAALEEDSLFGPTAVALVEAAQALPGSPSALDPAFAALAAETARLFRVPDSTAYYQRLVRSGDTDRQRRYLENECHTGRHGLFWLHVALRQAVLDRDFDRGEALLKAALPPSLAGLGHKLAGDLALVSGRPALALARYEQAHALAPWPSGLFRLGLAAWQSGDRDLARRRLAAVLAAMPEHVSAGLALYDIATGRDRATSRLPGSLAIALYTYNKGRDLDLTLGSLFASDIGPARVVALDNAADDDTPDVLAAWRDRVGPGRLSVIRLPVNIGAPAARNWLAADPLVREADFVAYLDDDVDLPADWLSRLAAAREAYPEAGVWGCRVADAQNPAIAQGVDTMPVPGRQGDGEPLAWDFSDAHAEAFDMGAFAHMRPCLSVMGCCHLFRRERLVQAGGFDIRYSPSQYDDVDHDLRLVLSGRPPVYQGHLAVGHRRPAPVFVPPLPDQLAGGQANRRKLLAKHRDRSEELAAGLREATLGDLTEKWRFLAEVGLLPQTS
uniref:Putative glycosyltransferase n=1 Tax=Desulfovibrio sp. U5L TaxID=596152 RepID=I2Q278_9BACT